MKPEFHYHDRLVNLSETWIIGEAAAAGAVGDAHDGHLQLLYPCADIQLYELHLDCPGNEFLSQHRPWTTTLADFQSEGLNTIPEISMRMKSFLIWKTLKSISENSAVQVLKEIESIVLNMCL